MPGSFIIARIIGWGEGLHHFDKRERMFGWPASTRRKLYGSKSGLPSFCFPEYRLRTCRSSKVLTSPHVTYGRILATGHLVQLDWHALQADYVVPGDSALWLTEYKERLGL
jgi:hypothetical protein